MPKKRSLSIPEESQASSVASVHPRVAFIKSVRFVGIGLDRSTVSIDRTLLGLAREKEQPFEIEVKINLSVLAHEDSHFVVQAEFHLAQRVQDSEQDIVSIHAIFSARFDLVSAASANLVKGFAQVESKLIFFPYLRHYVSDISYRMSIDPIVLPLTSELEGKPV